MQASESDSKMSNFTYHMQCNHYVNNDTEEILVNVDSDD